MNLHEETRTPNKKNCDFIYDLTEIKLTLFSSEAHNKIKIVTKNTSQCVLERVETGID